LLVLTQAGLLLAELNGVPVTVKQLTLAQVGKAAYRRETVVLTTQQRIEIRGVVSNAGVEVKPDNESADVASFLQKLLDTAARAGGPAPLPPNPDTLRIKELQQLSGNEQLLAFWKAREELAALAKAWSAQEKAAEQRLPRWKRLERLLQQAETLPEADEVARQMAAIREQRSLLQDPDPVIPLVQQLEAALRAALEERVNAFKREREKGIEALTKEEAFRALSEERRAGLIEKCGLRAVDMPDTSTEENLLLALERRPLDYWATMTDGLEARFARARELAAKEAYQAVRVTPPAATLKNEAEVDAYLTDLRQEIMKNIQTGKPVVI